MITVLDSPIHQCPFFPSGREMTIISPEQGGMRVVSIPYINVTGGNLPKRIKLYDFDNANYPVPEFVQLRMVMSQLRLINAKTGVYEDLLDMFTQHTQTLDNVA